MTAAHSPVIASAALALRHRVVTAIRQERRGEMSYPDLVRLVEAYREALRAYDPRLWPSVASLIRALG